MFFILEYNGGYCVEGGIMIEKLKQFILDAGRYSVEKRGAAAHSLSFKVGSDATRGIVTEVDTAISQKFKRFVEEHFGDLNYMIIDEESIADLSGDVFDSVAKTEYQFVIDPIDGTVNYAADLPMYGITVAVMKHGRPWLGFLYAPVTGELVYTDGEQVFFEYNGKTEVVPKNRESFSRVVMAHAWRVCLKPNHFNGRLIVQDYFSAVIYCLYLAIGRVKGAFMQANLWDIAGGMAICKVLGMGFYDYDTKQEMDCFSSAFFADKCQVKSIKIVCHEQDFDTLKNLVSDVIGKDE